MMVKLFQDPNFVNTVFLIHSYHDNQGHVCWPQSFKSLWSVSGPPVVEDGPADIKPTRRVNGQLPIDEVLVPFTL